MAAQVGTALKRIIKLLGEAGAGPEHIVRLTWYLTSRSEYEAAVPVSARPGRKRSGAISHHRRCSTSKGWSITGRKSKSK
jgi:enamine deaminase RidA (YjgF/YER057c/UK114 family)